MACDHDMPLSAIKGRYDFPIEHNNVYRSPFFDFSDHLDWQFIVPKSQLVLDAFCDVFSLSQCTHLICAPSNISSMAKIFNPSLKIIGIVPTTQDTDMIKKGSASFGVLDEFVLKKLGENAANREKLMALK